MNSYGNYSLYYVFYYVCWLFSKKISNEKVSYYNANVSNESLIWIQKQISRWDSYPQFQYADTEPISGNYYPVINRIYMKDQTNQLTVLTDRAQGGTVKSGALDLMV